ncbi:hypothetical protein HMPREF9123_0717 [Neisseria bacilliformis ATCC BAA-1200]|uniref:Uncharacterized protein n=1 Tax=Neisseria bacilliformis ATCC BAA-1200 TaxID=888742 RepID=F2BAB3_9NEIS|nr:hypothetical protein HMPREF9123_0717 [Neisseria bacilliformis ATCC BAA-1200]
MRQDRARRLGAAHPASLCRRAVARTHHKRPSEKRFSDGLNSLYGKGRVRRWGDNPTSRAAFALSAKCLFSDGLLPYM